MFFFAYVPLLVSFGLVSRLMVREVVWTWVAFAVIAFGGTDWIGGLLIVGVVVLWWVWGGIVDLFFWVGALELYNHGISLGCVLSSIHSLRSWYFIHKK